MPTPLILAGIPVTLATNGVYALPANVTTLFCADAAPALEQSNDISFATKSALVLVNGMSQVAGTFIRATTGNPTVRLSKD